VILRQARDLFVIYRLRNQGVRLDLKGALLRPASPLYHATARSLPGFGIWSGRVLTVVAREQGRAGVVQARWRTGVPAMDLLFIAPSLEACHGAAWLWQHLIHQLVYVGAAHGVQRLFAHLPEQSHAEIEVMRQAGFAIYSGDGLYQCEPGTIAPMGCAGRWQPRQVVDEWGLIRLYHAVTPPVVQQAESLLPNGSHGYSGWWGVSRRGCYVLRGDVAGDVVGHLRLTRGERGHWLKMVVHPDRADDSLELLREALSLMVGWPQQPVFCDVRDYEGYLLDALSDAGFERVMTRMLLVRHTTAAVRLKVPQTVRIVERAAETAPTLF
jgi:hypothetical protein